MVFLVPKSALSVISQQCRSQMRVSGLTTQIALVTILALQMSSVFADSWLSPQPIAAVSENAVWLVRVEPGVSIGDVYGFAGQPVGEYAEATLFKYDEDGQSYAEVETYRTRNPVAPVEVLISDSGWLIALDNWHNFGIGTVASIYDSSGDLISEFRLIDIFGPDELESLERSTSSIWWRCGRASLDPTGTQILLSDKLGRDISIDYVDGTVEFAGDSGRCKN